MNTNVYSPSTLTAAYQILAEHAVQNLKLPVVAGGTDLMVQYNANSTLLPANLLDIWQLDELRTIDEWHTVTKPVDNCPDALRVGALCTYTQLQQHPLLQQYAPVLLAAARTIGAVQIQNRGTLGGNIVNASPAGDSLPVLAAFDALLEIGSARGVRQVPFNQFYQGYRQTVLAADELLLAIILPKQRPQTVAEFYKVGTRAAQAISKVVMAIYATTTTSSENNSDQVTHIAIALGSVAPTVIRAFQTEQLLTNQVITPSLIDQARQILQQEIAPISDVRSNATYRRVVSGNLLAKFFRERKANA
jgi:CO/xanthine dehydrogenase FAD-binding subunit